MTTYRQAVWANGFRPIPVRTKDKAPSGRDWPGDARQDPPPCAAPDAKPTPWAQSTGILCDGLRAVDVDIDDPEIVSRIRAELSRAFGAAPMRVRKGSARILVVYRAAEGEPKKRVLKGTAGKVEILGHGQQFVADGIHPDGDRYAWDGADLLTTSRSALPAVTEAQIDALFIALAPVIGAAVAEPAPAAKAEPPRGVASASTVAGARERAFAEAALEENARELSDCGEGGRNNTLNGIAFRMGRLVGAGWIGQAEVEGALISACRANGLVKDDGLPSVRKTMTSGLAAGIADPHEALDPDGAEGDPFNGERLFAGKAEAVAPAEEPAAEDDEEEDDPGEAVIETGEFPVADLEVEGLVGDIARWICAATTRPMPLFATAAALTVVAALVGRRVMAGMPETCGHTYMILVGGVGSGKQWPGIDAPRALLDAATGADIQQGACLWQSSMSSSASIGTQLKAAPLQVQTIDEIDKVLRKGANRNASNQEATLLDDYCTLWGTTPHGAFSPETTTVRGAVRIYRPHLALLGGTTPQKFNTVLRASHVAGGFLSRCLVLPAARVPRQDARVSMKVPEELRMRLRALWEFHRPQNDGGTDMTQNPLDSETPPAARVIPISGAAQVRMRRIWDEQDATLIQMETVGDPLGEVWARYGEQVLRIAMTVAVGRHAWSPGLEGALIEERDVVWAEQLVRWSLETLVQGLRRNMAETPHQEMFKTVLGLIRKHLQINKRDLINALAGQYPLKAVDQVLELMVAGRNIKRVAGLRVEKEARGRKPIAFQYLRG